MKYVFVLLVVVICTAPKDAFGAPMPVNLENLGPAITTILKLVGVQQYTKKDIIQLKEDNANHMVKHTRKLFIRIDQELRNPDCEYEPSIVVNIESLESLVDALINVVRTGKNYKLASDSKELIIEINEKLSKLEKAINDSAVTGDCKTFLNKMFLKVTNAMSDLADMARITWDAVETMLKQKTSVL